MTRDRSTADTGSVTDLGRSPAEQCAGQAVQAADAAARAAGVRIREVTALDELTAVGGLYDEIWRRDRKPPVTTELLRALAKSGNYVGGAFDAGQLVGACVAFFSAPAEDSIHSHIAGVSASVQGRSVGFALKLHQRAWALLRGISTIVWTFDPLVSRNAYFNLAKLAATPVEYLPNFYGGINDGINGSDDSDRLLVHWTLAGVQASMACAGTSVSSDAAAERRRGGVVALGVSDIGGPVPGSQDGGTSLVAVPRDIQALRVSDPGLAKQWRAAVREAMVPLMADGARVTGFDPAGWYILRRDAAAQHRGDPR